MRIHDGRWGSETATQVALATAAIGAPLLGMRLLRRLTAESLEGRAALVTGGSRGLGFIVARELLRAGCRVAICARDPDELDRAAAALRREGEVAALPADVADQDAVKRLVAQTVERFGGVDVLVNNAGIIEVGPLDAMTVDEFARALDVMFWGVLYASLAVLPHMRRRGWGRIVNVTSIGGKIAVPHLLPYGCAKFAAVGLSEGLRAELARDGISVVTVVPGLMRTGSHVNARFRGRQEEEYALFALGATLPFVSMDAERAARAIVRAARIGRAEVTLSLPAKLAARVHGLFPGATAAMLGLLNTGVLPADGANRTSARGGDVHRRIGSRALDVLTALGRTAAERFQHPSAAVR